MPSLGTATAFTPLEQVAAQLLAAIPDVDFDRLAPPSSLVWRDFVGVPTNKIAPLLAGINSDADLDGLAPPSQRTWRDVFGARDRAGLRLVIKRVVEERRAGRLSDPLFRALQALRWVNRAVRRGVLYSPDALGAAAEAYAERFSAWLGHRWRLPQAPTFGINAVAIFQLAELINARWQAGMFELFGRREGRGELQRIEPIGCILRFQPDRDRGEWIVSHGRQNTGDGSGLWRDLVILREAVHPLVVAVKQSVKTLLGARPGVRTTSQEKAEEEAGRRIKARSERDERPRPTVKAYLARLQREISGLTGAAARRQWQRHAKAEWHRRSSSDKPGVNKVN